jgi:hypothetical protein
MDDDRVVAVRIDGTVREEDVLEMVEVVEDKLTRHEKLRAYVEVEKFRGIGPQALFEDLKMGLKHWRQFERKAAVIDPTWLGKLVEVVDPLFPWIELRAFPFTEKDEAVRWISE